jgi:hypothetical protein
LSLRQFAGVSWVVPSIVGLVLALVVVGMHLAALGADPSVFVRAAPPMADPGKVPASLRTLNADQAYDGQFFYRLAVDPLDQRDVGISFDGPSYRHQRLLYPLVVSALALGQEAWVPWLLIGVNVAGLAVLGLLGARYAVAIDRPAWWGIALPLYVGFSYTLARDLAEIVEACLLIGALLAVQTRRIALGAALMALAVLARETAVVLAGALIAAWAWNRLRRTPDFRPSPAATRPSLTAGNALLLLVGSAGAVTYLAVQIALGLRWGVLPTLDGAGNLAAPFSGLRDYLTTTGQLGRLELAWFVTLCGIALLSRAAPVPIRVGLVGYLVLLASLSSMVWAGDAAWLRAATEATLLAWLSLFYAGGRRVVALLVASGVLWPAVARWAIAT